MAGVCGLAKVVGIHIKNDAHLFGQGGSGKDLLDMVGERARIPGAEEELKAEKPVRFGGGRRVGSAKIESGREILGEPLVEILKSEFGEAFVVGLAGEKGGVAEGRKLELVPKLEFLIGEPLKVVMPCKLD